jgi:rifampin ADP-ribosylating transferase
MATNGQAILITKMGAGELSSRIVFELVLEKLAFLSGVISMNGAATTFAPSFFHGTKANFGMGDLITPGYASNYGTRKAAAHVYLTATLDAAIWGAELAVGEGGGRIYVVEPVGAFEDDPNLTDKKFPGNPSKSYRTESALHVIGEVTKWTGHSPEQIKTMKDHIAKIERLSGVGNED